jgi:nicotinamide mononucleotide transporter
LLQCVYVLLLVFGWYNWTTKQEQKTTFPVRLNSTIGLKLFSITFAATLVLGFFLKNYTNASLPWIDSALTCASLSAQWMIAKKIIDNWIVWIVVDVIYIPVYIFKHLPLTAILYAIFLIMAFRGYREWKVTLHHE